MFHQPTFPELADKFPNYNTIMKYKLTDLFWGPESCDAQMKFTKKSDSKRPSLREHLEVLARREAFDSQHGVSIGPFKGGCGGAPRGSPQKKPDHFEENTR